MNTEMIEQQVQATLENKTADVRDAVRQVTLKALSGGELDTAALRRVMDAVVKGAQRGAASRGEQGRQALSDAMKGLDEALAVAAEATRLALQEAAGRTSEFSRHEIERALDDLKGLESLFIETLSDAARSATGFAEATLRDLAGHARSSGTAVGHQVTAALAQLGDAIAGTAETQLETGTQTLRASGALLASMASGMLAGIAGQQRLMLWQALTTARALGRLHDIASILICYGFGNIVRRMGLAATLCLVALPAAAAPTWLIATADETAQAGAPIVLDVVKPAAQADWPGSVRLKLMRDGKTLEIPLAPVEPVSAEDTRRAYRGALPAHLSGLVRVDLAGVESNRLALLVSTPDAIEQMQSPVEGATKPGGSGGILFPVNEPALSVNEPMYFVIGSRSTARFQLSFKYRLFDPDSLPVEWFAPLAGLHFGYTQTSLWDLGADSAPFYDTSYRPSLFWQGATSGKGLMPDQLRAGYEHESNGKDGADTRSIDTLFAQPVWRTEFPDGRALIFAPKVYAYLDKSDNPDIQRYRGYANWNFRYGREDGWLLATQLRTGTTGHGSAQLDLSWPLRRPLFARTGGFLHIQLFKGYGESLLDYNLDRGTQVRVGFSIVR